MFFSSHKKRARELGQEIQNSLKIPFLGSPHLSIDGGGEFSPPDGFYRDTYIFGMILLLIQLTIQYVEKGSNWSQTKKEEYLMEAFSVLDPNGDQGLQETLVSDVSDMREDAEFKRGSHDAGTLFGVMFGKIKPDDPDPILVEARLRAPEFERISRGLGLSGDANSSLGAAVSDLTIGKHVRQNYLGEQE